MKAWIALVFIVVGCSESYNARDGGDGVGNGGDSVEIEFRRFGLEAADMAKLNYQYFPEINESQLRHVIENSKVIAVTRALSDGVEERDAINLPETGRILVNRDRWLAQKDADVKRALVFHEYLGLARIDDVRYRVSSQLLDFDVDGLTPVKKKVDILFVIDDSGSMGMHQENLSRSIDMLLGEVATHGINYHLGVVTTSIWETLPSGARQPADPGLPADAKLIGSPRFLTQKSPNALFEARKRMNVGTDGTADERFFVPVLYTLQNPFNAGFLRATADLEVIFVTDGDEKFGSFSSADFLKELSVFKKSQISRIRVNAVKLIGVPGGGRPGCDVGEPQTGLLDEAVRLTGGSVYDLCERTYLPLMKDLGQQISLKVNQTQ